MQSPEETVPTAATGNLPNTAVEEASTGANPNLSGFSPSAAEPLPQSLDTDPANRSADRLLACLICSMTPRRCFGRETGWMGLEYCWPFPP